MKYELILLFLLVSWLAETENVYIKNTLLNSVGFTHGHVIMSFLQPLIGFFWASIIQQLPPCDTGQRS